MDLLKEITKYSKRVISGKVISCEKHQWACKRFLDDLENQNTDSFPFYFDINKAQRFVNWMSLFKHSKGILAGQYIDLDIFWKFVTGNIYGWYHKDTGYRRFSKAYVQVARKNWKSGILSGVGLYETFAFLDNEISNVYCIATKKEQAEIVYEEALNMLHTSPHLKGKFKDVYKKIEHIKSRSTMRALSKDTKKKGDGLHPQCGIIDEYHAHEDTEMYDVIDSGDGARAQPLIFIITTAGPDLNAPCYRIEYSLVSSILNPDVDVDLDHYFAIVCELETNGTSEDITTKDGRLIPPGDLIDRIDDEKAWPKANPVVCSYPEGRAGLRKKLKEALNAPEKLRNFKTKRLNVWVNERVCGYLNPQRWAACKSPIRIEIPKRATCYIGLDLSAKIDLTSVSYIFPGVIVDKYIVLSHSFIPDVRMRERMEVDKMPFDLWVKDGWVTTTPGETVDYRVVKDYVLGEVKKNNWHVEKWCLDPYAATQIMNDLIECEGDYAVVEIRQGSKTLSEPTKIFRSEILDKNIIHDGNPLMSWAIGNAVVTVVDRNENILISKTESKDRIDPLAATINGFTLAMVDDLNSGYNSSGMRSLA